MNKLALSWIERHKDFGDVDILTQDEERTAFVDYVCDQAGRVPLFATLSHKPGSTPSWDGPSHSLQIRYNYDENDSQYFLKETVLKTPLISLTLNRRAIQELSHLDILAKDPAGYMRTLLAPLLEKPEAPSLSEEEALDAVATSWAAEGCKERENPQVFFSGSHYLGPSSHDEILTSPPFVKIRTKSDKCNPGMLIIMGPQPYICSPWQWNSIDLMQRIARHKERRESK